MKLQDNSSNEVNDEHTMIHSCILPGDVADPSIILDGEYYYLVHSTFVFYPGLLIHKSKDLVNWTTVTHAVKKNVGDIWAPELVKHNNIYYIYFPANGTNWVIWSENIESGWSEPINLCVKGLFDPGHIAENKTNKRFLFFNDGYMVRLNDDGLSIDGELHKVYEHWDFPSAWDTEGICLESPKLFLKNNYYYLIVAQGGTAGPPTSHMAACFRSKELTEPWESSPFNPIIHTYSDNENYWSTGHGTVFEGKDSKYYMVYHGYRRDNRNLGREILLSGITWDENGWFKSVNLNLKIPKTNYDFHDDFTGDKLKPDWSFFGGFDAENFNFTDNGLSLKGCGENLSDSHPMVLNNRYTDYEITAEIIFNESSQAGITLFYNEKAHVGLCFNSGRICRIVNGTYLPFGTGNNETFANGDTIYFKIRKKSNTASFYYSTDGINFTKSQTSNDVSYYEHNVYGGFLALRPGIFSARGENLFKSFLYREYYSD